MQGILFAHPDDMPMLRSEFNVSLIQLSFCGYQSSSFKDHSFPIGAATAAALRGQASGVQMLLESISDFSDLVGWSQVFFVGDLVAKWPPPVCN